MADYTQTPTFKEVQRLEQAYGDACEKFENAYRTWQYMVDEHYAGKVTRPALETAYLEYLTLDAQASNIHTALDAAKNVHLAYIEAVEDDCDCTPLTTCSACYTRAAASEIEF